MSKVNSTRPRTGSFSKNPSPRNVFLFILMSMSLDMLARDLVKNHHCTCGWGSGVSRSENGRVARWWCPAGGHWVGLSPGARPITTLVGLPGPPTGGWCQSADVQYTANRRPIPL
jgi:hypothetical protein